MFRSLFALIISAARKPVFVDGSIYAGIALATTWTGILTTDNAAKFISPEVIFWTKVFTESAGAVLLAMKMYRSTAYADHRKEKESETAFLQRQLANKPPP